MVDRNPYYLGAAFANQSIALQLDAQRRCLTAFRRGQALKIWALQGLYGYTLPFADYLTLMLAEARSFDRQQSLKAAASC